MSLTSVDVESGLPDRPKPTHIPNSQNSSLVPVLDEDTTRSRRQSPQIAWNSPMIQAGNVYQKFRMLVLQNRMSKLSVEAPSRIQAEEADVRIVRTFGQWCCHLYKEEKEKQRSTRAEIGQSLAQPANITENNTNGMRETAIRVAHEPANCVFLCWLGSADRLAMMTAVPILDSQNEVAVFECLRNTWYKIHGQWRSFVPFHGVIEVKEVKVSPSYPYGKFFKAELDELDLATERSRMLQELPGLNSQSEGMLRCECVGKFRRVECVLCEESRYEYVLRGIPKLSQLVTCFHNPQAARGSGLLHSLLYISRGQPLSLVYDIRSHRAYSQYTDSYIPAYLVKTGWCKPRTWLSWSWSIVLLAVLPLPIWTALSKLTDHQVGVGQLVVGSLALVVPLMIFKLPNSPD